MEDAKEDHARPPVSLKSQRAPPPHEAPDLNSRISELQAAKDSAEKELGGALTKLLLLKDSYNQLIDTLKWVKNDLDHVRRERDQLKWGLQASLDEASFSF